MKKKIAIICLILIVVVLLSNATIKKYKEWRVIKDCSYFPYDCYQDLNRYIEEQDDIITKALVQNFIDKNNYGLDSFSSFNVITTKEGYLLINVHLNEYWFDKWENNKNQVSEINYGNISTKSFLDFLISDQASFTVFYN